MILRAAVAGERVTINHLPDWRTAEPLWERWLAHVADNENGVMGCDVETTAIDDEMGPFEPTWEMRLIQFGSRRYAWCLDPHDPFWRPRIEGLLHRTEPGYSLGLRFVSHTNYDPLSCAREFDIPADDRWIDTMPMACLLWPGHTPKDLKSLTSWLIDPQLAEAEVALLARFKELAPVGMRAGVKTPKAWGFTNIDLDDEVFARYAGLDTIYVRRLLGLLDERVRKHRMAPLSRREQRIARLCTRIRIRGQRVDLDWARELLADVDTINRDAYERVESTMGCKPTSPKRGDWLLDNGAIFTELTPTGRPQITMPSAASPGTLPDLAAQYAGDDVLGPVFADLLILGHTNNLRTNLTIIVRAARDGDGYVHPQIRTMAAHTGRMSIVKPAMQTFKKRDREAREDEGGVAFSRLRGCFISDDGWSLVTADYASQEVRIAAALSRDRELLRIVRDDLNQHTETAKMIFGPKFVDKSSVYNAVTGQTFYDCSKTLDFAQQYGAWPRRIGDQLNMPRSERLGKDGKPAANPAAVKMWLAWREAYSGLVEWTDRVGEMKIVRNDWGRRIPADSGRGYANGNYLVQSTGRDVLGDAMCRLEAEGWGDYLWLLVHDEIVLHVPDELAEAAAEALERLMATSVRGVPLVATAKILGTRWGALDE